MKLLKWIADLNDELWLELNRFIAWTWLSLNETAIILTALNAQHFWRMIHHDDGIIISSIDN